MQCPQCSSEMWDNRENKKNPKGPDYKCKDKACGHAIWLNAKSKSAGGTPKTNGGGPKWTWSQLGTLYHRSLLLAQQKLKSVGVVAPDAIVAATATIFIAASRDGVADPPKKAEPLEERPAAFNEDSDDSVPF